MWRFFGIFPTKNGLGYSSFDLEQKWLDSRLQFYNLKPDQEMNTLVYEEKSVILVGSCNKVPPAHVKSKDEHV